LCIVTFVAVADEAMMSCSDFCESYNMLSLFHYRQHRSRVVHWNQLSSVWRARKDVYVATSWESVSTSQHERSSLRIQTCGSIKWACQRLLLRTWLSQKLSHHSTLIGECCRCAVALSLLEVTATSEGHIILFFKNTFKELVWCPLHGMAAN